MSRNILSAAFSRLTLAVSQRSHVPVSRLSTNTNPLLFRATPCLLAEPMKKKKRIDPQVLKNREERKRKKIERQIRKLEKNAQQLKPIDELEVSLTLLDSKKERTRKLPKLTEDQVEERALLIKDWSRFKHQERTKDLQMLDTLMSSQKKALDALREESEDLYQEAIQVDLQLLPFTVKGPVWTPPIKNYESPDGEYADASRKWD